jgi:hypothetical protein
MNAMQRAKRLESMARPLEHGSTDANPPVKGLASGSGLEQNGRPRGLVVVAPLRGAQSTQPRQQGPRNWAYRLRAGLVVVLALVGLIMLATQVSMVVVPAQQAATP